MGVRYGGRQKGTPNKRTMMLLEKAREKGVDPFDILLDLCLDEDKSIRLQASKETCQYLYPKRKAIEITHDDDSEKTEKLTAMLEKLGKLELLK